MLRLGHLSFIPREVLAAAMAFLTSFPAAAKGTFSKWMALLQDMIASSQEP